MDTLIDTRVIHKYTVEGSLAINLANPIVLTTAFDPKIPHHAPAVWIEHTPHGQVTDTVILERRSTGHEFEASDSDARAYLGTVVYPDGPVDHVYFGMVPAPKGAQA